MNDAVTVEADGHVRILTLNRPDSLNAFDDDLHRALPAALREVEDDREARVIVLTGAGRAFSAGGNIEDFDKLADDLWLRRATLRAGRQLFEDIVSVHLPIIAAVNGPAVGLGCTLATACDFVLVSDKAFLADPHVQVALVAGDGGAVTWPLSVAVTEEPELPVEDALLLVEELSSLLLPQAARPVARAAAAKAAGRMRGFTCVIS